MCLWSLPLTSSAWGWILAALNTGINPCYRARLELPERPEAMQARPTRAAIEYLLNLLPNPVLKDCQQGLIREALGKVQHQCPAGQRDLVSVRLDLNHIDVGSAPSHLVRINYSHRISP